MIFCVVCCASVLVDLRIVWENSPKYHRYLWKIINMPSLSYLYGFSDCCEGVISYQVFKKSPLIVHHFIPCQDKTDYPFMIHHSLHRLKQAIYQHFTRNHTTRKKEWVFLNYNTFLCGVCRWILESLAFFTQRASVTFLSYFSLRIQNPQPVPEPEPGTSNSLHHSLIFQ